ncbi:MAG TPA: hypothetical protein VGI86_11810 [Acidimicrobiia bacterium]|jgi:hypothetical protein
MALLRRFHGDWGYIAIVVNALSGLYALAAWKWPRFRGRPVWIGVIFAELALMLQVITGAVLVSSKDYKAPGLHYFYGYVAFISVGLLYSYRYVWRAKGRMELAYGLGGLFLMGVGIRGILQVV